jgi:hypothetical protein
MESTNNQSKHCRQTTADSFQFCSATLTVTQIYELKNVVFKYLSPLGETVKKEWCPCPTPNVSIHFISRLFVAAQFDGPSVLLVVGTYRSF